MSNLFPPLTKSIILPCYGIVVEVGEGVAKITSDLHSEAPEEYSDPLAHAELESALDGIESLILACACNDINIQSNAFVCAVETAVEAAFNNKG